MEYTAVYESPLGRILLAANKTALTGLWFEGQKYYAMSLDGDNERGDNFALKLTRKWLDLYFGGTEPGFMPPVSFKGTDFQAEVWSILCEIPYGKTVTYGDIAAELAKRRGLVHMSAQAVGGAVARNNISIIVPCHRVVGAGGSLTGYAGGIEKKIKLLELEGSLKTEFFTPKNSTAP